MLTSLRCAKGDLVGNLARHHELMKFGGERGCDLVLLPEMSLTGYQPSAAMRLTDPAVVELVVATTEGPAVCFGVVEDADADGRPYITQVVADRGSIVAVHRKTHLGEGEDADFQAGVGAEAFEIASTTCTVAVCAEIGTPRRYAQGSRLVLCPSAPGLYGDRRRTDADWRRGLDWWRGSVIDDAIRLLNHQQMLVVSTQAGATIDEDFPGWAAVLEPGGKVLAELADGREATIIVDV